MKFTSHKIFCLYLFVFGIGFMHSSYCAKVIDRLESKTLDSTKRFDSKVHETDRSPKSSSSPLKQTFFKTINLHPSTPTDHSGNPNSNIRWDSMWASTLNFGQISAVSVDPNGNIGVFHRGERIWDFSTFDNDDKFDANKGAIRQNTIMLLDKAGKIILEWGRNMFFLPHGLTIDSSGNYWITDVAMHQVFKFDGKDIEKHKQQLERQKYSQRFSTSEKFDINNLFANSIIKPMLILGEAFQPGNDNTRFCKPTAVAVLSNGDFFVSDGYCNFRIIKCNKNGERVLQWGQAPDERGLSSNDPPKNAFLVPHALALAEEHDLLFIADRENGRVICNFASNGTFYKEYKNSILGAAIYSVAYANDKIYVVNGNRYPENVHVRGYILDIYSTEILSQFAPPMDMDNPHDIAVTPDGKEIYIVELDIHKIYKFYQDSKDFQAAPKTSNPKNDSKTS